MNPRDVERLREGLRRNVHMGCALDVAQATADALLALLRRDWAVRVLDAWAESKGLRSWRASNDGNDRRVTLYERGMRERETPVWSAGPTPDAARHAAAVAVWPELTHEQCREIGACP